MSGSEPVIVGQKITAIRILTEKEMDDLGWHPGGVGNVTVLTLENGTELFPSQDPEGNGPGCIFGKDSEGEFIVYCLEER